MIRQQLTQIAREAFEIGLDAVDVIVFFLHALILRA
jgi:hypothetical protein